METKCNHQRQKYYEENGLWTDRTLLDYWEDSVMHFGHREYLVDDLGCRLTYAETDTRATVLAAWMQGQGITAGDVVSLQVTPRSEYVVIVIACLRLGAVIAPIGMRTGSEEWIRKQKMIGSKMHFCVRGYHGDALCRFILNDESGLQAPPINVFLGEGVADPEGSFSYEEILGGDPRCLPYPAASANDVALIMFTSGTTHGSRGVMLTHNNILSSEMIFNKTLGLTAEDSMFMPAPLSHATGFHHGIVSLMLLGGKLVLQEKYEGVAAIRMITEERCTYSMGATPFVYDFIKLLDEGMPRPEALRFYICGGAPVPATMVRHAWEAHHVLVCECYGSTESVPHVLVPPEKALAMQGQWSGHTMEGIEVRVVDENHHDVAPGEIGEEASRGPQVFVGYYGDMECTNEVLDDDGWYYSGDLCRSDGRGNIHICGRKKDIIVRGGENLNTNEINEQLEGCPGVCDHAVIGMPDERMGECICAFLVMQEGAAPITREQVAAYLNGKKVSKWLWPERIELIDAIPYTESGKIKKYLLQQELERRMNKPCLIAR